MYSDTLLKPQKRLFADGEGINSYENNEGHPGLPKNGENLYQTEEKTGMMDIPNTFLTLIANMSLNKYGIVHPLVVGLSTAAQKK